MPLLNASLTDCVFEVERATDRREVNGLLEAAAAGPLAGILGYEDAPACLGRLHATIPAPGIVDAPSTMVVDETQVKVLAWYDNEWGYANRLVELARARCLPAQTRAAMRAEHGQRSRPPSAKLGQRGSPQLRPGHRRLLGRDARPTARPGCWSLFYFYELGYSAFAVASLFIFYEIFGIVTNLVGGWLAARFGLRTTLFIGTRNPDLRRLRCWPSCRPAWLVVPYVMVSQAFSGIAKDLTKMSSKSAVKLVVPEGDEPSLYRWVAILTGSKNALKGVGFFLGGLMLTLAGFQASMAILAGAVSPPC